MQIAATISVLHCSHCCCVIHTGLCWWCLCCVCRWKLPTQKMLICWVSMSKLRMRYAAHNTLYDPIMHYWFWFSHNMQACLQHCLQYCLHLVVLMHQEAAVIAVSILQADTAQCRTEVGSPTLQRVFVTQLQQFARPNKKLRRSRCTHLRAAYYL